MRDKLLFGTIGLLVGIVVMQWTMPNSQASYVSPTTGIVGVDGHLELLDQNGVQWNCAAPDGWYQRVNRPSLPVPVASLKFWGETFLVTQDNHVWLKSENDPFNGPWTDYGAWPGSPVANDQSTWGKVKAKFGAKGDTH